MSDVSSRWSAPVRYAEVDQQSVVFNAHYLTYCDEALAAFCRDRDVGAFAEHVMLKTSTLTWHAAARHGDIVDVDTRCVRVGATSLDLQFVVTVGTRTCCEIATTYVHAPDGGPVPIPEAVRAVLGQ